MKAISAILLVLALSACASQTACEAESRAVVPTYANSIGDMIAATELEQRCLAR